MQFNSLPFCRSSFNVNEIAFSYEKMGTKTRFEEEVKGNSEMAYYIDLAKPKSGAPRKCCLKPD